MNQEIKHEAATHARRATKQAKDATKNVIRAAEDLAEPVVELIEGEAEEIETAVKSAPMRKLAGMLVYNAKAIIALTVAVYATKEAVNAFKTASLVARAENLAKVVHEEKVG